MSLCRLHLLKPVVGANGPLFPFQCCCVIYKICCLFLPNDPYLNSEASGDKTCYTCLSLQFYFHCLPWQEKSFWYLGRDRQENITKAWHVFLWYTTRCVVYQNSQLAKKSKVQKAFRDLDFRNAVIIWEQVTEWKALNSHITQKLKCRKHLEAQRYFQMFCLQGE